MIAGIEHLAIATADPEGLAQWYVDTLGFVINYRGKTAFFVKAPNGSMIEIIPAEGEGGPNTPKTPGMRHIALAVSDFEAEYEKLKAKGVEFIDPAPMIKGGNKVIFFRDPVGTILHFIERSELLP